MSISVLLVKPSLTVVNPLVYCPALWQTVVRNRGTPGGSSDSGPSSGSGSSSGSGCSGSGIGGGGISGSGIGGLASQEAAQRSLSPSIHGVRDLIIRW